MSASTRFRQRTGCCMLMANVLKSLFHESSLLAPDSPSFKRQESIFVVLNLFILAVLLLIHTLFSSVFGQPPWLLIVVLAAGFLLNVIELIWLQGANDLSVAGMMVVSCAAIALNMSLAFILATLSYRQDLQYFALLVAPILQAAFRFSSGPAIGVVAASVALEFFWIWNYFRLHPPPQVNEYLEGGTIALIYAMVGTLVWLLVHHLRSKEADLKRSLAALEQAKERLLSEEKLAAVGRLSSAIAHEIRNPVAMISSALSTAFHGSLEPAARQEMFEIASKEASRLEKLTTDFLVYARPKAPAKEPADLSESLAYIADVCRARAGTKAVSIRVETNGTLQANVDTGQIQQALLNLVINAMEASQEGGLVILRGTSKDGLIGLEVENANGPIPHEAAERIFEPFFTTKHSGTGLGLAIARGIARAHGGDLVLSCNGTEAVRFSLTLPAYAAKSEHSWAES